MIKVENLQVYNIDGAIRGMRNPKASHDRSDTKICTDRLICNEDKCKRCPYYLYMNRRNKDISTCTYNIATRVIDPPIVVGEADMNLAATLCKAGTEHRKFLRQILVCFDITAPLYWFAEADTYKVGVVRDSYSFMHKGVSAPFKISDFSVHDEEVYNTILHNKKPTNYEQYKRCNAWTSTLNDLNELRDLYLKTKDDKIFQQIRCLLPSGYNQKSTMTMNYENIFNIICQRKNHRLDEWREFCVYMRNNLPYLEDWMEM